ncbi:MAG: hypothetical protein ABI866_13950, partial [Dokdonella sp.]
MAAIAPGFHLLSNSAFAAEFFVREGFVEVAFVGEVFMPRRSSNADLRIEGCVTDQFLWERH